MFRRILQYLRPFFRPREWFKLSGRLLQWSPEATIALTFTVVLMIIVVVFFARSASDATTSFYVYLTTVLFFVVVLVPACGIVAYILLRLCFQAPYEVFEDIERDWSSGLAELQRKGLDIRRIPLYLVLGGESNDQVHRLFKASGVEFSIVQHPAGRSSLSWYANQDAIFIACNEAGILSDLGRQAVERLLESRVIVPPQGPEPNVDLAATYWPTDEGSAEMAPVSPARQIPQVDLLGGTMEINDEGMGMGVGMGKNERRLERDLQLGHDRMERDTARLEYLCRLIAQERKPYAPINGMVTLLPINMILGDSSEGSVIRDAVRGDVTVSVRRLGLRFPVVAVVNGWEDDSGFQELIRRLPPHYLTNHRFGKGAQVGHDPKPDYLEAICHHVCKAFEDSIYNLFKQPEALKKTGNRALYDLLCKVRRYLRARLMRVLTEGYDCGKNNERLADSGLFLGCYMLASGRDAARRAFVFQVFDRLFKKNKDLQWTPAAERGERNNYRTAYALFAVSLALVIAAIILFFFPPALG